MLPTALCIPVIWMVVLCCRLCGKRVDCTCLNCFSDGSCKCCCCQIEVRKFRPLPSQAEGEGITSAVPPTASTSDRASGHRSNQPQVTPSGEYSYANPDRVIFSLHHQRAGRRLDAGSHPNRVQEPRAYEVPLRTGSGTTVRHLMQQPPGKEQLSHTDAAIATQPHSTHLPTRPDRHRKGHPTGLSPDASQHFTSPPPALPPKGIRPSLHGDNHEWLAHHKLHHTPDARAGIDCPLLVAAADDDFTSAMLNPATNVPVSICAAPPPLPPKPRPLAVPIIPSPGAT